MYRDSGVASEDLAFYKSIRAGFLKLKCDLDWKIPIPAGPGSREKTALQRASRAGSEILRKFPTGALPLTSLKGREPLRIPSVG